MGVGIGIDIGSRTTRVVKLVRRGNAIRWTGSAAASTVPDDAEATADDLPAKLKEAGIVPRGGVVGLSGRDTIIRYSRVPLAPPWKLKMLVGYEATQAGELDVSFNYRLLSLPAAIGSNELTVMTAVAKNEVLSDRLDSLARRGIKGADFAPNALALYEVFSRCPEADEALDEYCLVIDVGASETQMVVVHNGELVFARSVAFGGRDFTKAVASALRVEDEKAERLKVKHGQIIDEGEVSSRPSAEQPMLAALAQAAEEFFGALRASLMFARAQTKLIDLEVGRIYLSGAGAGLKGMPEFLEAKLGVRATFFSPPDDWNGPDKPGTPGQWMIALGLALVSLEHPEERMSLLPSRTQKRRRFWRRNVFAYASCAVFALAAAAGGVSHIHNSRVAEQTLEERKTLRAEAQNRNVELDTIMRHNAQKREHLALLSSAGRTGVALAELVGFLREGKDRPGRIVLSKLTFRPGDMNKADARSYVRLSGSVGHSEKRHRDVLDEFCKWLKESSWFDAPSGRERKLIESAPEPADGTPLTFRVKMPLRIRLSDASARKKDEQ